MGIEDPEPVARRRPSPIPSWRTAPPPLTTRLGWLGIASAALDLGSVYLKGPAVRPGVTWGDAIDVLTPLVLVLLYALVLRSLAVIPTAEVSVAPRSRGGGAHLLLPLGAFALVLGHGIHVAANSIDDAITRAGIQDPMGLVDWWDEHVSHTLIHGSKAAFCVALTALEIRRRAAGAGERGGPAASGPPAGSGLLVAGALFYGFIYFADGVEGQTVALLLPFCAAYLAWSLRRGRPFPPVRRFYTLGAIVSVLLFIFWGVWHRGFPEFSKVGLIP